MPYTTDTRMEYSSTAQQASLKKEQPYKDVGVF